MKAEIWEVVLGCTFQRTNTRQEQMIWASSLSVSLWAGWETWMSACLRLCQWCGKLCENKGGKKQTCHMKQRKTPKWTAFSYTAPCISSSTALPVVASFTASAAWFSLVTGSWAAVSLPFDCKNKWRMKCKMHLLSHLIHSSDCKAGSPSEVVLVVRIARNGHLNNTVVESNG